MVSEHFFRFVSMVRENLLARCSARLEQRLSWQSVARTGRRGGSGSRGGAPAVAPERGKRGVNPLLLLGMTQFVLILDVTIVNVGLPSIQKDPASWHPTSS